jgi:penicillin amidase
MMYAVSLIKRIGVGILAILILAVAGGYLYVRHIGRKGLPDYSRDVRLAGMREEVTIYRDAHAVPHIFAKNEDDLYRAVGYVMAQDRLWQMDLIRRATQGRLAEIFGRDLVETDLFVRALRIPEKSRLILSRTEEPLLRAVQAFADGVNQFIDAHLRKLPPEFTLLGYAPEKWTPEHSMNLVGFMAMPLAVAMETDLLLYKVGQKVPLAEGRYQELIPNVHLQKTVAYPEFTLDPDGLNLRASLLRGARRLAGLGLAVFSGSNNWAVSGARSVTGKPILANDMHLALSAPGIWYQIHEVVEERFNVTGVALPGTPMVIAGHNDRIAWGITNVMNDDVDFYLEKINPDNADEYEFNGAWRPLEVRKEVIRIRKGEAVERELRFTHRGPIVSELKGIPDRAISMRWAGNDMSNEARSVYLLNRATNWEDFKEAVRSFRSLSQNIIYADVDGNIGLYCCAGIPIRKGGIGVAPGETDEYDWKGYVPFEELPHVYNPSSGVVASANNKSADDCYPYYISYLFDPGYRIDRIRRMLAEKDRHSVKDFCRMQSDVRSGLAEKMMGVLISAVRKLDHLSAGETQALALLESWDCQMTQDSAAALLFDELYSALMKNLVEDELGEDLATKYIAALGFEILPNILADGAAECVDDLRTAELKENFDDIIRRSFRQAVAALEKKMGSDPERWQWGRHHLLHLDHPMGTVRLLARLFHLNRGPYPVPGSGCTVCPFICPQSGQGFEPPLGASHRHVFSLADWDASLTILPTGESGIPASPFYCDQTRLYLENKYHSDYVSRDLVEKTARFKMRIGGM